MTRALILQYGPQTPPGLLGEWLTEREIGFDVHRAWLGGAMPDPAPYAFVVSLGSERSVRDAGSDPMVDGSLETTRRAVAEDVPVLGLCFGGQVLAAALGGSVERAPEPETGWQLVDTGDPESLPGGPWLEWHYDRFTVPPGATEVARSAAGPQAFRLGPHLGVQFHPEATIEIVTEWAAHDVPRLRERGLPTDPAELLAADPAARAAARAAAFRLFDAFLARAGIDAHGTDEAAAAAG